METIITITINNLCPSASQPPVTAQQHRNGKRGGRTEPAREEGTMMWQHVRPAVTVIAVRVAPRHGVQRPGQCTKRAITHRLFGRARRAYQMVIMGWTLSNIKYDMQIVTKRSRGIMGVETPVASVPYIMPHCITARDNVA